MLRKIKKARQQIDELWEQCNREVEDARELERRHKEVLEGLRSELEIAHELIVPELAAAQQAAAARWNAEIAVQAARQKLEELRLRPRSDNQ